MSASIIAENITKCFDANIIFTSFSYTFSNGIYGITGTNGSGKSTLIKCLSGYYSINQGTTHYLLNNNPIPPQILYRFVAVVSPYLKLFEDFSLAETIENHATFKPFFPSISSEDAIKMTELSISKHTKLKEFSSGMLQKVKLLLAVLSDTPFLFLDEPFSNLDQNAVFWGQQLIRNYAADRIVLIATNSNDEELSLCEKLINIEDYKTNV